MSRTYFNGVNNLSFNGTMLSFVLDDTYQISTGKMEKGKVIELMSEVNSVEGVCKYLLGEIEKIKSMEGAENNKKSEPLQAPEPSTGATLKLGKKISSSSFSNN